MRMYRVIRPRTRRIAMVAPSAHTSTLYLRVFDRDDKWWRCVTRYTRIYTRVQAHDTHIYTHTHTHIHSIKLKSRLYALHTQYLLIVQIRGIERTSARFARWPLCGESPALNRELKPGWTEQFFCHRMDDRTVDRSRIETGEIRFE